LLPLQQIDREEEAPARNEGATIIRHLGENGTFVLPALDIEAADYAFRLRSSSYGEQAGSNPRCTLLNVRRHSNAVGWRTGRTAGSRPTLLAFLRAPDAEVTQPSWLGLAASRSLR
jgi:hypothetical protein